MKDFCIASCCFLILCDIYVLDKLLEGRDGPILQNRSLDKVLTSLGTMSSRIMALISLRLDSAGDLGYIVVEQTDYINAIDGKQNGGNQIGIYPPGPRRTGPAISETLRNGPHGCP